MAARSVAMTTASNSTPDGKSTSSPMARSGGPPRPGVSTPPSPRGTPRKRDAPLAARTPHVPLGELASPARRGRTGRCCFRWPPRRPRRPRRPGRRRHRYPACPGPRRRRRPRPRPATTARVRPGPAPARRTGGTGTGRLPRTGRRSARRRSSSRPRRTPGANGQLRPSPRVPLPDTSLPRLAAAPPQRHRSTTATPRRHHRSITAPPVGGLSRSTAPSQYPPGVRIHAAFRAIGSFAVRFRWFVLVAWIIAAVAVPRALPSLSSVTQGNNANFLPASAPSEHALKLAAPLGGSTLTPVPVVAASTQGTLTPAEQAWLQKLQQDLGKVPTVVKVRDLGNSPDGQAAQLQVLSNVSQGGAGNGLTTLVKDLRGAIARDGPPSGLDVHLAGAVAIQVDQQAKSGSTDSQIQLLSVVFIIGLLLLVFRALLAPLVTLIPAFLAVTISGPLVAEAAHHGLKVSPLAQILLIVLVLGAGTDYGLFLVFRVRENLRAGQDRKQAVIAAVERVGESITFSAATVVAALLSLLAATFEFYSDLGIPLAIGIGVMLLAGLTLLPALLAI